MTKRYGALLCLLSFSAQLALTVGHEWQSAVVEADYHQGAPVSGPALGAAHDDSGPRHHHHDPATCRVCPALSSFRVLFPEPIYSFRPTAPRSTLVDDSTAPRTSVAERGSASPRSPPTA